MTKFEYRVTDHHMGLESSKANDNLDGYGERGWELVSAVPLCMHSIRYIFKRTLARVKAL